MTNSLTIFLVDSSWPGVSVEKNDQTIGNLNQAKITFRDVLVPDGKKSSIHFAFLFFNLPIRFFFHRRNDFIARNRTVYSTENDDALTNSAWTFKFNSDEIDFTAYA